MIHIVPTVPPNIDGLGDYCHKLWQYWPSPKPAWHCLATVIPPEASKLWPEATFSTFSLSKTGLRSALNQLDSHCIVLHYVGYGYHPKGVPIGLPAALKAWKQQSNKNRVVTMFHETHATGHWKQSAFWLRPLAKNLMVSLAQLSDFWVTSCPDYAERIQVEAGVALSKGAILPIGATIMRSGPAVKKPWPLSTDQRLRIVIFGLPNTRLWAVQEHENLLRHLCSQYLVEQITLLGKPATTDKTIEALDEVQQRIGFKELWREEFDHPVEEISRIVSEHHIGLLSNYPGIVTKSTAYAMFCEHDVIPVARSTEKSHEAITGFPCFVSQDSQPQVSERKLRDDSMMAELQESVRDASQHILNWESITSHWQRIIEQVTAEPKRNPI